VTCYSLPRGLQYYVYTKSKTKEYTALPQFRGPGEHPDHFTYSNTTKTSCSSTFWPLHNKTAPILAAGGIMNRIRVPNCPASHTRGAHSHLNQSSVLRALVKRLYISRNPYTFNTSQIGQVFLVAAEGRFGRCGWAGSSQLGAAGTCITLRAGTCALASFSTLAQV